MVQITTTDECLRGHHKECKGRYSPPNVSDERSAPARKNKKGKPLMTKDNKWGGDSDWDGLTPEAKTVAASSGSVGEIAVGRIYDAHRGATLSMYRKEETWKRIADIINSCLPVSAPTAEVEKMKAALQGAKSTVGMLRSFLLSGEFMHPNDEIHVTNTLKDIDAALSLIVSAPAEEGEKLKGILKEHKEWMEADGMRSDGVPIHDCDFELSPESGTCEFHELYAKTEAAISSVPSASAPTPSDEEIARETVEKLDPRTDGEQVTMFNIILAALKRKSAAAEEVEPRSISYPELREQLERALIHSERLQEYIEYCKEADAMTATFLWTHGWKWSPEFLAKGERNCVPLSLRRLQLNDV